MKCFGRKFLRSFRTKAAKDSWSFVSLIEKKDPNKWKQSLKWKQREKGFYWTTKKCNLKQLES